MPAEGSADTDIFKVLILGAHAFMFVLPILMILLPTVLAKWNFHHWSTLWKGRSGFSRFAARNLPCVSCCLSWFVVDVVVFYDDDELLLLMMMMLLLLLTALLLRRRLRSRSVLKRNSAYPGQHGTLTKQPSGGLELTRKSRSLSFHVFLSSFYLRRL